MKPIADGKTKTLFAHGDDQVMIVFKDTVTGTDEGIDPGGNQVVGRIEGKGLAAFKQSVYFFNLLAASNIPTHFVSADAEKGVIIAQRAKWLGLEFIVRYYASGSFVRRYGRYVQEGTFLGGLIEITVKDDERGDPLIVDDALVALGLMNRDQVAEAKSLVKQAAGVIREDLSKKGLELIDIKFECGLVGDRLVIIDDISTDNMRVVKDGRQIGAEELLRCLQ